MSDLAESLGRVILTSSGTDDPLAIVRRTADAEDQVRELLRQAVASARSSGHSWAAIGAELGMSRQAAQQRFGEPDPLELIERTERWLGPVTAFDEMRELDLAGQLGWHTVGAGMLRHRMVQTPTKWQHKRVLWTGSVRRHERNGWQVGCRAYPWVYLIRDTGEPA